jgi:hypothetical protein
VQIIILYCHAPEGTAASFIRSEGAASLIRCAIELSLSPLRPPHPSPHDSAVCLIRGAIELITERRKEYGIAWSTEIVCASVFVLLCLQLRQYLKCSACATANLENTALFAGINCGICWYLKCESYKHMEEFDALTDGLIATRYIATHIYRYRYRYLDR